MSNDTQHGDEDLRVWKHGQRSYLMARDGRLFDSREGRPVGPPHQQHPLAHAEQEAKRDPNLRQAESEVRSDGKRVFKHKPPLRLVFEEGGIWFVRRVQLFPLREAGTDTVSMLLRDPIPLHGDSSQGWLKLRARSAGLIMFHAPSEAAQLFGISRDSS